MTERGKKCLIYSFTYQLSLATRFLIAFPDGKAVYWAKGAIPGDLCEWLQLNAVGEIIRSRVWKERRAESTASVDGCVYLGGPCSFRL